jgi:hypothetical protein
MLTASDGRWRPPLVRLQHEKIHAAECEACETWSEGLLDRIEREIEIEGPSTLTRKACCKSPTAVPCRT